MKTLRKIHTYLGIFFTPLLLFFVITGCFQSFGLHHDRKDGYVAPKILSAGAEIHMEQRLEKQGNHSVPFRYFVVAMSISFILTSLLGVVLAFQMIRPKWKVCLWLALGLLLPAGMLWLEMG